MNRSILLTSPAPTAASERIPFLDVLKGAAIWGVLAADMIGFSSPETHFAPAGIWTDPISRVTAFLLDVFVSEKFVTLFAVAFGVGFGIQMERAASEGLASMAIYRRRLLVLFLIGLAHGLFVWAGDILVTYAFFGLVLLLFRNRSQKTIIGWTVGLQAIMFILSLLSVSHGKRLPQLSELQATIELYGEGSWRAIQHARTEEFLERHLWSLPLLLPFVFPRFLFGLWLWRRGFVKNLAKSKPVLRRVCFWGVAIGGAGEAFTAAYAMGDMGPVRVLCIPLLAAGYASAVALLVLSGAWPRVVGALAAVGRSSLTNYLFQRILCTTLFFSYGLGLFGRLSPLSCLALSTSIYGLELALSAWWMNRFRFGPVEWVWRSAAYLRRI